LALLTFAAGEESHSLREVVKVEAKKGDKKHAGGKEIKQAIMKKVAELQQRLDKRNHDLDQFLDDRKRVRSFLVRSSVAQWSEHYRGVAPLHGKGDISSEEIEENLQLFRRIYQIEQEIYRLTLVKNHLNDEQALTTSWAMDLRPEALQPCRPRSQDRALSLSPQAKERP
jgi:hypothetical protein